MESYIWSNAITIWGKKGPHIDAATEMPRDEAKRFISTVKDALKRLEKLSTGRLLLNDINTCGHTCKIYCAPDGNDGAAQSHPMTLENNEKRMIRSFRPQHLNHMAQTQLPSGEQGVKILKGIKEQLKAKNQYSNTTLASMELDFILVRAWGTERTGRNALAQLLNKPIAAINDMCDGVAKIPDDDYFKICFAYYEFLMPGPGCDTQVKLKAGVKLLGSDQSYKPKKDSDAVAPEIILGHELIHAWRMMKGRRVVAAGWEEEAMTTGCAPFTHIKVTENALRREGGYPPRMQYKTNTYSTSLREALTF